MEGGFSRKKALTLWHQKKAFMTINVYEQYFGASIEWNGEERKGVRVCLVSDSCEGNITYTLQVNFFPHRDKEDFGISYDALSEKVLFQGKGRRSRKREEAFLLTLRDEADSLASALGGKIDWDDPLIEARRG